MKNIIKTARGLDKALSIMRVVFIFCLMAGILAILIAIIAAGRIVELINESSGEISYTSGALRIWPNDPGLTIEDIRKFLILISILDVVVSLVVLFTIRLFKGILGDMKEGRPFSANMPARIRLLAYMIFCYALIIPVIPLIQSYLFFTVLDVQQILSDSPLVKKVGIDFSYHVDFLAVFIGFVVILLSWVFEYGAKLQIESDETL